MNYIMKRERDEEYSVPEDVLNSISQKPNSKVARRDRVIDETPVDQDLVDAMTQVTDKSDLRDILQIRDGVELEVKWNIEDEEGQMTKCWLSAKVTKSNTGEQHKFVDEDDEEEFTYAPVVQIKYDSEEGHSDICFISDHMIYDIEEDCIMLWRKKGDDFDDPDVEHEISFVFTTIEQLENEVKKLVPKIFINVISKFKTQYEMLPFTVRREWDARIVMMKDLLVKKIIEHFKKRLEQNPHTIMTLGDAEMDTIFEECFKELDGNI